jgi:hypothetical protein
MHSYLPKHSVVLFTGHAIFHGTLEFIVNNILVLHMILEIFNIVAPVINEKKTSNMFSVVLQVLYLLLHMGLLFQLIWQLEDYLYGKHVAYIQRSFYTNFHKIALQQEQASINAHLTCLANLMEIRKLVLTQIDLYASSFSILIKITIVTILIYIKNDSRYRSAILGLPIIYSVIVLLAHSLVIRNKKLESSAKNQILNYLILLLLVAVFPSLSNLGMVIILLYPIIIQDLTFEKWYLYNNNHRKLTYLAQELITNCSLSNVYTLHRPQYTITIQEYFRLFNNLFTNDDIVKILDSLNLVPELLKLNDNVLQIKLNDSRLTNKIALQIAFLNGYHLEFKKMLYDSSRISETNINYISQIAKKLHVELRRMNVAIA